MAAPSAHKGFSTLSPHIASPSGISVVLDPPDLSCLLFNPRILCCILDSHAGLALSLGHHTPIVRGESEAHTPLGSQPVFWRWITPTPVSSRKRFWGRLGCAAAGSVSHHRHLLRLILSRSVLGRAALGKSLRLPQLHVHFLVLLSHPRHECGHLSGCCDTDGGVTGVWLEGADHMSHYKPSSYKLSAF